MSLPTTRPAGQTSFSPKSRLTSRSRASSRASSPSRRPRSPFPSTLRPSPSFVSLKAAPAAAASISSPQTTNISATSSNTPMSVPSPGTNLEAHNHPTRENAVTSSASSIIGVSLSADDPYLMRDDDAASQLTYEGNSNPTSDDDDGADTEVGSDSHRNKVGSVSGKMQPDLEDSGGTVMGTIDEPMASGEARKGLREQLRRTLTRERELGAEADMDINATPSLSAKAKGKQAEVVNELPTAQMEATDNTSPRQYFVLTEAGKPVFVSEDAPIGKDEDALSSTMSLVQALMSIFIDEGDKLRCINAGRMRITFLQRSPLYLVCVSNWGEPESVTRQHLEYLHLQILSVFSGAHLRRIFEKRTNYDLRRQLSGAEVFLHSLLKRMQFDLAIATSSLLCLRLDPGLRRKIGSVLVPSKLKDILYVMLIASDRVVTLVRPKKHSVHPADLHILLNTVHAPAVTNTPASWLPICLPRFNNNGFLHAYVTFPRQDDGDVDSGSRPGESTSASSTEPNADRRSADNNVEERQSELPSFNPNPTSDEANPTKSTGLCLVCVSGGGGGEFEAIRKWCDSVTNTLNTSGAFNALERSVRGGTTEYDVSVLGVPGLRHFVYKSRPHVQVTHPIWGDDYKDEATRRRLITLYQTIHDAIHGKSGQTDLLKLQYLRSDTESVMGWITTPFELYICMTPTLPKSAVVNAANAVMRWVKKEESSLFLKDAPVF